VVASDRGALREVLGDAALLCDPQAPESIAAAIREILDDEGLRADLRARGLRRVERFRWDRCARRTADAYREAVQEAS
jgi:glycosyltransferase involved in cell wall biosynthesis